MKDASIPLWKSLNESIETYRFTIASTPIEERHTDSFNLNVREHYDLQKQYKQLAYDNLASLAEAARQLIVSLSEVLPFMEIEANEDGDMDNHAYQIYLKAIGAKNDAEAALKAIS